MTENGSGVSQLRLHSWVSIFFFSRKKGGLHKVHVRLPRGLIGNGSGSAIPVQERSGLFRPSTAIVGTYYVLRHNMSPDLAYLQILFLLLNSLFFIVSSFSSLRGKPPHLPGGSPLAHAHLTMSSFFITNL